MTSEEAYRIYGNWIAACEASDKLSEWEANFITSIKKYLEDKGKLSPKQADVLERIYTEKTD